jgi:hypothetical protein
MLQLKSIINVIDNSGAVWAECIRVLHGGKYARIGKKKKKKKKKKTQGRKRATCSNKATLLNGTGTSQGQQERGVTDRSIGRMEAWKLPWTAKEVTPTSLRPGFLIQGRVGSGEMEQVSQLSQGQH